VGPAQFLFGLQQAVRPARQPRVALFLLGPANTKADIEFFTKDTPPNGKRTSNKMVAPNGQKCFKMWEWRNGKGYLRIYFDANGVIVDRDSKDLPKN